MGGSGGMQVLGIVHGCCVILCGHSITESHIALGDVAPGNPHLTTLLVQLMKWRSHIVVAVVVGMGDGCGWGLLVMAMMMGWWCGREVGIVDSGGSCG